MPRGKGRNPGKKPSRFQRRARSYRSGWRPKHNKIYSGLKGKPNEILTQRTLDYGIIDLEENAKHWQEGGAKSAAEFNFPNFNITMMTDYSDWANMFGRYKLKGLEIRLIPCYSYQQVLQQGTSPTAVPGNTISNVLITRLQLKYDSSDNASRFQNTYGIDDVKILDQFIKKKTTVVNTADFKGFKIYTREPRQISWVAKSIENETQVPVNTNGRWNDFDGGAIEYVANDTFYVRNADSGVALPTSILRYRVIYKVYLALSGFQ